MPQFSRQPGFMITFLMPKGLSFKYLYEKLAYSKPTKENLFIEKSLNSNLRIRITRDDDKKRFNVCFLGNVRSWDLMRKGFIQLYEDFETAKIPTNSDGFILLSQKEKEIKTYLLQQYGYSKGKEVVKTLGDGVSYKVTVLQEKAKDYVITVLNGKFYDYGEALFFLDNVYSDLSVVGLVDPLFDSLF